MPSVGTATVYCQPGGLTAWGDGGPQAAGAWKLQGSTAQTRARRRVLDPRPSTLARGASELTSTDRESAFLGNSVRDRGEREGFAMRGARRSPISPFVAARENRGGGAPPRACRAGRSEKACGPSAPLIRRRCSLFCAHVLMSVEWGGGEDVVAPAAREVAAGAVGATAMTGQAWL